jgi:hypothetical protein
MTRLFSIISVTAFAFVAALVPQPANAAVTIMCAPEASATGAPPRPLQLPTASQNYVADAKGCIIAQAVDVPLLRSQGWLPATSFSQPLQFTTGVATGTTSFFLGVLPPSAVIDQIVIVNSTANAVTGGIAIGSTSGGADVVAAQACAANCTLAVADSALLKRAVSATAPTQIFATAVTSWNSANVTVSVLYSYF